MTLMRLSKLRQHGRLPLCKHQYMPPRSRAFSAVTYHCFVEHLTSRHSVSTARLRLTVHRSTQQPAHAAFLCRQSTLCHQDDPPRGYIFQSRKLVQNMHFFGICHNIQLFRSYGMGFLTVELSECVTLWHSIILY